MTPPARQVQFSERSLVEEPAIRIFQDMEWDHVDCRHEKPGPGSVIGRANATQVVLTKYLEPKLRELNPELPDVAIENAIRELQQSRRTQHLVKANRAIYEMLRQGVEVRFQGEHGEKVTERVRVVDLENPGENDFLLASQLTVNSPVVHRDRRPDLVGFVNGLPLVYVALKRPGVNVKKAFNDNLRDYKDTIPQLFWYNAVVVLSNGADTRVGSFSAGWEHFGTWQKVESETERRETRLEKALRGTCQAGRLLDLVSNFTLYTGIGSGSPVKILSKNHQYLGVNNAYDALRSLDDEDQQLGVFWHTQGSGKSFSMAFFAQKVLREYGRGITFVVITDRVDLSDQVYKKAFADTGLVHEDEDSIRAQDGEHLKELLQEDHRFVFTRIQKFQTDDNEPYPVLSERNNVIVMTDEAHRYQYDTLAMNMRRALPNARYLALTATPLKGEVEKTQQVFGPYVSIYNFSESTEDGATVRIFYENRIPRLSVDRDLLEKGLAEIGDDYNLDEEVEDRLVRTFSTEKSVLIRDDRLEQVAEDIVEHFVGRCFDEEESFRGKGMVVSIGKYTTVRMWNKVQKYWQEKIEKLRKRRQGANPEQRRALDEKIDWMDETDMAAVISSEQNEVADFRDRGLDIVPHRERMETEDLKTKFQDPEDPFRLVFLCAKWLTGFDAPSCSTMYLDKPMKKHSLMQAIARTNRTFRDKQNGLIVDYVGILHYLKEALSIYAEPRGDEQEGGGLPVEDKETLFEELKEKLEETVEFCRERGIDLEEIAAGDELQITEGVADAREELLKKEDTKNDYLGLAREIRLRYKAVKPDERLAEDLTLIQLIEEISRSIRSLAEPPDTEDLEVALEELLDEAVSLEDALDPGKPYGEKFDLSEIDFDELKKQFDQMEKKHSTVERLRALLEQEIHELVSKNRTCEHLLEQYEEIVDEYNLRSERTEQYYQELLELARKIREEKRRPDRENMTEEELAVFDILMEPDFELGEDQKKQVKRVAKELLDKLKKDRLITDWKSTQETQAGVETTIKQRLAFLPPLYSQDLRKQKRKEVYTHIYDKYDDASHHAYAMAG